MYTHILVSTDGSELAGKGVSHGLALARALGCKATVITVTQPFPIIYGREWQPTGEAAKSFRDENQRAAEEVLTPVRAQGQELGISVETLHVPEKSAANGILEAAKDLGCDLIVMSSHGRTGISKVLLGSQANKVVAHSSIPVLIVR